jgi:hypothetical protein
MGVVKEVKCIDFNAMGALANASFQNNKCSQHIFLEFTTFRFCSCTTFIIYYIHTYLLDMVRGNIAMRDL